MNSHATVGIGATATGDQLGRSRDQVSSAARAARSVSLFNPISKFLLSVGVPLGPNGLITVRGRKSGLPRTTPVAIIEVSGRRWVWAPWGEVNWVRNLRVAGRATITVRRRSEEIRATELDETQRVAFFRDVLGPLAQRTPYGIQFIRIADGVDLTDLVEVVAKVSVSSSRTQPDQTVCAAGSRIHVSPALALSADSNHQKMGDPRHAMQCARRAVHHLRSTFQKLGISCRSERSASLSRAIA